MLTKVKPPTSGRYILAVSGGLDSMTLLDILARWPELELIVAHFNHGIRDDSDKDETLVGETAAKLGLRLEVGHGGLGKASEAEARRARYAFLDKVKQKYRAKAIITAHHLDDLIETVFINILRGSGPRGLVSIISNPNVSRPLINVPRKDIEKYAKRHKLRWREDSTNQQDLYLRNYIRRHVMPKISQSQRGRIVHEVEKVANTQKEKNQLIATISHNIVLNGTVNRAKFANLPTEVADELVRYWLLQLKVPDLDRQTINRLNLALKTSQAGRRQPIKSGIWLNFEAKSAYFSGDEFNTPLSLQARRPHL